MNDEERLSWGAPERNKGPLLAELQRLLPEGAEVLEIASGTGQHAAWFARHLPSVRWWPSDLSEEHVRSIAAWRRHVGLDNLHAPVRLDVLHQPWPVRNLDAVFCANMIHIAPWAVTPGLLDGAGQVLKPGGLLVLYGPFLRDGVETASSNVAFDRSLRERDPTWGIRRLEQVEAEATGRNLTLFEVIEMPANNLTVVFQRT